MTLCAVCKWPKRASCNYTRINSPHSYLRINSPNSIVLHVTYEHVMIDRFKAIFTCTSSSYYLK